MAEPLGVSANQARFQARLDNFTPTASGNVWLFYVRIQIAVLRGLSTLVRRDVFHEASECHFRKALRLNRLLTQASEIVARFP